MHRICQRLIVERTALVNQMRALLLERGIAVPVGRIVFGKRIGEILENAENGISVRLRELLRRSRERWLRVDQDVEEMTSMVTRVAESSELCRQALTVPGVGPIVCQPPWWQPSGMLECSAAVATWPPGSGSFRVSTRLAVRPHWVLSVNAVTPTCGRYASGALTLSTAR